MSNDPIPGPAINGGVAQRRRDDRTPTGVGSTAIDDAALIIVDVSSASTRP